MAIAGIGTNTGIMNTGTETKTKQRKEKFDKTVMQCVSAGGRKVMLRQDALMSYASPRTGESVNIYRADNYSKDNPRYILKGLDADGREFEKEVDASKINPYHCSYNELMVLNLETGNNTDALRLKMCAIHDKSGADSYFDSADYMAYAKEVMRDYKTMGNWSSYLAIDKWMRCLVEYMKGSALF